MYKHTRTIILAFLISAAAAACAVQAAYAVVPTAPTSVTPQQVCSCTSPNGRIILYWTDASTNENQFIVQRAQGNAPLEGDFAQVAAPASTTEGTTGTLYSFEAGCTLAEFTKYTFRVRAVDTDPAPDEESSFLTTTAANTTCDATAPTSPSVSSITADSSSQLTISAAAGADTGGSGLNANGPYWFNETTAGAGALITYPHRNPYCCDAGTQFRNSRNSAIIFERKCPPSVSIL